jgi:hypothetical protein
MDFLKRHYEKVVLGGALIALIVSAVVLALRVNGVSNESPMAATSGRATAIAHTPLGSYSNALQSMAEPALWTSTNYVFIPIDARQEIDHQPTGITTTVEFPVKLLSVVRKPFKLLFMAYSPDAATGGYNNFQINFQFRARTFFIPAVGDEIKDRYDNTDTGYRIAKFEKKSIPVYDAALGRNRDKDVSELTVQHETDASVVLVLNKESEDQESVAEVRCTADGSTGEYRRGQELTCPKGTTYKVIDIDSRLKQMVIVDTQTQKQHIIRSQQ